MSNNPTISTSWNQDVHQEENIDLFDDGRLSRSVGDDWVVRIEPKKPMFNFFRSNKKISCDLIVKITDMNVAPALKINQSEPLLRLHCDGETHQIFTQEVDNGYRMHLNDLVKTFTLQFNTLAVTDILTMQTADLKTYPVQFRVGLYTDTGECVKDTGVRIGVSGSHVLVDPEVDFKYDRDAHSVKYDKTRGEKRIGVLKITNPSMLNFSPNINMDVEIAVKRDNVPLAPTDPANPVILDFSRTNTFEISRHDPKGLGFSVTNFAKASSLVMPLKIDYSIIDNPVTNPDGKVSYDISVNIHYRNVNEPDTDKTLIHDICPSLEVLKNSEVPMLQVGVVNPEDSVCYDLEDNQKIRLSQIKFQPGEGLVTPIKIKVANLATDGVDGAGIFIDNISVRPKGQPNLVIKKKHKTGNGVEGLFSLDDSGRRIFLPNTGTHDTIDIRFDGNDVYDLYQEEKNGRKYDVVVGLEVTFDYYLDENADAQILGDDFFTSDRMRKFRGVVMVPVHQLPNQEWLAIDFGTSAIVAKYGDKMLDLHGVKQDMPRPKDATSDNYEIGTPFLSSNLVLRQLGEKEVEGISQLTRDNHGNVEFGKQAIFLSPTSYEEQANSDRMIPCLKLIVGYDLLPNIDNYVNYNYQYCDANGELKRSGLMVRENEDGYEYDEPTPLANIDTIFGEVYSELLRYYIRPTIKDEMRKINRLVLTVPNTYTPRHIERIEEIVRSHLSDLNIREIQFVSESDAVACYYQRHWTSINRKIGRTDISSIKKVEHVMVYDIGAGTLDVTLFKKVYNDESKCTLIEVLGKIGISKAGNYLDSLLADLLARKFQSMRSLSDPKSITDASGMVGALELKAFIKNKLKPALSHPEREFVFEQNFEIGIKKEERVDLNNLILSQPKFRNYIKEITDDFIDNFFEFFCIPDNLKIDTVLLSGRTAKLKTIHTALEYKLKSRGSSNLQIIPISSLNEEGSEYDKSKTIVVEGAVNFADLYSGKESQVVFMTPALNANYGIIYIDIDGAERYVELLNPRDYKEVNHKGHDYKTKPISVNLGSVKEIKLVQTFSADTARDWISGNREYITVMAEVSLAAVNNRANAQLSLSVGKNGYLTLQINGQELQGLTSSKIDINSPSNARSLWPTRTQVTKK